MSLLPSKNVRTALKNNLYMKKQTISTSCAAEIKAASDKQADFHKAFAEGRIFDGKIVPVRAEERQNDAEPGEQLGEPDLEPWQMTQKEWNASKVFRITVEQEKEITKIYEKGRGCEWAHLKNGVTVYRGWAEQEPGCWERFEDTGRTLLTIEQHKEEVQKAVTAGLPVPPEVLADYPDIDSETTSEPVKVDRG